MLDIGSPSLKQAATVLNADLNGKDVSFSGISIDSRTVEAGNLFIAIKGPNFDGHDYIKDAQKKGAVAAVVSKKSEYPVPDILVPDTKAALTDMAQAWRSQAACKFAGITGSNGKTTVKDMLSSILSLTGPGLKTKDNLNNDFGVSLTLLRLKPEHQWAVVEMGVSGFGEMEPLAKVVRPFVALVNNVAPAHIAGFASIREIAVTKGAIYKYLPHAGVAVMPYGSEFAKIWQKQSATNNIVTFGFDSEADVIVSSLDGKLNLQTPKGAIELSLPLGGAHNHLNAAAATAVALQFGVSLTKIRQGLERVGPAKGRLQTISHRSGAKIIDDTYNANPVSVKAALDYLAGFSGKRVFVLGDMGELGARAQEYHGETGKLASDLKIDEFISFGDLSKFAGAEFKGSSSHFTDMQKLIQHIAIYLDDKTTVLVKGSRFMQMQRLIEGLMESGS